MAALENSDGTTLEPDTLENVHEYEADSGIGSDIESTRSASITSSITGYKYENGRRCGFSSSASNVIAIDSMR